MACHRDRTEVEETKGGGGFGLLLLYVDVLLLHLVDFFTNEDHLLNLLLDWWAASRGQPMSFGAGDRRESLTLMFIRLSLLEVRVEFIPDLLE